MKPIMETFNINYTQWGMINTGALLVGGDPLPMWGWLYDKHNRAKLLALASLLWGTTTWFSALAPNFGTFLGHPFVPLASMIPATPACTAWSPTTLAQRAVVKIYGALQFAQPLAT
jgi:MFS family permease